MFDKERATRLDRAYHGRMMHAIESCGHFDANETVFLERELTQLRQKIFEVRYPDPVARTFLPKATDIAASADTYAFKVYRPTGVADLIAYKTGALPRVDMTADEVQGKVRPLAAAYGWDINELREAARLQLQLSEVKARAARMAIERAIDEVLAFGSVMDPSGNYVSPNLNGLVNNSLIIANGILTGTHWSSASDPTDMLNDLNALVIAPANASLNVFVADTLLLPLTHYNLALQTPWSALTGESVLSIFKKNNPQVTTVAPWHKLNSVTTAQGGNNLPRGIAFMKDSMTGEAVIPQEFEQFPPEIEALNFLIACHARCGGTKIYQPLAYKYTDFS